MWEIIESLRSQIPRWDEGGNAYKIEGTLDSE